MLGPLRSCMYPRTFRSISVRNATASKTGTMKARGLRMCVISVWIIVGERI